MDRKPLEWNNLFKHVWVPIISKSGWMWKSLGKKCDQVSEGDSGDTTCAQAHANKNKKCKYICARGKQHRHTVYECEEKVCAKE